MFSVLSYVIENEFFVPRSLSEAFIAGRNCIFFLNFFLDWVEPLNLTAPIWDLSELWSTLLNHSHFGRRLTDKPDIFLESFDNSEQNQHRCIFYFFLKIFWVRLLLVFCRFNWKLFNRNGIEVMPYVIDESRGYGQSAHS